MSLSAGASKLSRGDDSSPINSFALPEEVYWRNGLQEPSAFPAVLYRI